MAEIQQVSNGFAPEFGNTVGRCSTPSPRAARTNSTAKAATFSAAPIWPRARSCLSATGLVPDVNVDAYAVDGGGRVIKDRLFWFGAFEHVKRDLPGVVTVSAANIAALGLPADYANPVPFRQSV